MTVKELSRGQLVELKRNHYCSTNENVSMGELMTVDTLISDEEIFEAYSGVDFVEEDFFGGWF